MSVTRTPFEERKGGVTFDSTTYRCWDLEWVPTGNTDLGQTKDGTVAASDAAVVIQFADDPGKAGDVWVFYGFHDSTGEPKVADLHVGPGCSTFVADHEGSMSVVPLDPERPLRVSLREISVVR